MLGLQKPLDGHISRYTDLSISYVPQRDLIDTGIPITVLEVVLMGLTARSGAFHRVGAADREAAWRALGLLGDEALGPQLFRNLSKGQQRRVLLARALAGEPNVLVLDEPTAGMDIASEAAMIEFLRELNQRRRVTIVIVTHLLPIVLNLATSIMLMGDHAILQGPMNDVLREDRLAARTVFPCISASSRGDAHWSWATEIAMFEATFMQMALLASVATGTSLGILGVYLAVRRVVFFGLVLANAATLGAASRKHSAGRRLRCRLPQVSLPPQLLARSARLRGSQTSR